MESDDEEQFWADGMTRSDRVADAPMALRYSINPDISKGDAPAAASGRFFTDADNEHSARVMVVDQAFAQRYFPGRTP